MLTQSTPRRCISLTRQEVALLVITVIWGSTFLIVHLAVRHSGPLAFVGVRFVVAGLLAAVVFHRSLRGLTLRELGAGSAIGVAIFLGYGLQTYGLQTIPSSTSAFLTALYVPLVPLLEWAAFRRAPRRMTWIGITLAFVGLLLLAGPQPGGLHLNSGAIVTLVSTLPIAGEVILIGLFAGRLNMQRLTVVQLLVAGILAFALLPFSGERIPAPSWSWLAPAIALGVASCIIQATMNWAQKSVSPSRATVIYAGEPVWGGVVGRLAGDRLPGLAIVGAVLIVAGTLVSELKPRGAVGAEGEGSGGS